MAVNLTPRDIELLALGFQCLKDQSSIQIDYQKLAELGGFKTPASANASFLATKKKLLAGATSTPKKPSAKSATKGNATQAADHEDDGDDDAVNEGEAADDEKSPAKATPKKKGRKPKNATNGGDDVASGFTAINDPSADAEVLTPQPKKRVRKPKDPNALPAKRGKKAANVKDEKHDDEHGEAGKLMDDVEPHASGIGEGSDGPDDSYPNDGDIAV